MTDDANRRLYGQGLLGPRTPPDKGPLRAEFGCPPFTVLDAREGSWQDRKRRWLGLGIESELGRADNLGRYSQAASLGSKDTSIFDPVLCELVYRWFCPAGGVVLDPFAGGSVRGIVASVLGLRYCGVDLRADQTAANQAQATRDRCGPHKPRWLTGSSLAVNMDDLPTADLLFSCPPYGNLEQYSDDPADLSTRPWKEFRAMYWNIVRRFADKLRDDRFACFVVGNYRHANGCLHDLVGWTTSAFRDAGLRLYNEAVLVTAVGSASMRSRRIFNGGRKLCRTHQSVLVFVKGDWKAAAAAIGATNGEGS